MSWLEALILGIVQGLTEFLPVSSSGHLEIGQALLGTSGEDNLTFAIIVHTATVLSTLVVLWREVAQLFKGTFTTLQWNSEKDYVAKILVSMIPVFIVGMFFKDQVEAFARASRRGWEYAAEHPEEALSIVMDYVRRNNIATNPILQRLMLDEILRLQLDPDSGQREFRLREDMVRQASELMLRGGMIRRPVTIEDLRQ